MTKIICYALKFEAVYICDSFLQGGRRVKFSVMVVCGNYHGVIGFAKAKDEAIPSACQKVINI